MVTHRCSQLRFPGSDKLDPAIQIGERVTTHWKFITRPVRDWYARDHADADEGE